MTHTLIPLKLSIAAGMKDINVDTQYMFLDIFAEMKIPKKRSSLRGISAQLTIEQKNDRSRLHIEDTPEGWNARFAMDRNSTRTAPDSQRTVQIMINVNMVEHQHQPHIVEIPIYINACTHGWIHPPYKPPTEEMMEREGDVRAREIYWADSITIINNIVQSYRPSVG